MNNKNIKADQTSIRNNEVVEAGVGISTYLIEPAVGETGAKQAAWAP